MGIVTHKNKQYIIDIKDNHGGVNEWRESSKHKRYTAYSAQWTTKCNQFYYIFV